MAVEYRCCETGFFLHVSIIAFLVLFAGLMSGLTLGLMSMSLVDLEVLAKSGTPRDSKHACKCLFLICILCLYNNGALMPTDLRYLHCSLHVLNQNYNISPGKHMFWAIEFIHTCFWACLF